MPATASPTTTAFQQFDQMNRIHLDHSERKYVPLFIMGALILEVMTLCFKNWMEGYYGDVIALTLCPWRLCHLNCLRCSQEIPTIGCFWIQDWDDTGFESFGVVAHLEYWCLGFMTLALLVSILDWAHAFIRRRTGCPMEFSKPTLLVLIVGSLLSTLSVSLFGAKIHHNTSEITTYKNIRLYFGWPYIARVAAAILAWAATVAAICNQCRSSTRSVQASDESIMVISAERDFADDSMDEAENGALL